VLHMRWLFLTIAHFILTKQQVVYLGLSETGHLVNSLRLHATLVVNLLTHRELLNHVLMI